MRRFSRVTGRGWARSAIASGAILPAACGAARSGVSSRSWSVPPRHAIGALDAYHVAAITTQAQFGRAEQPIHDVVRRAETVVHQLPVTLRTNDEQRRQFTLRDACGELDIDFLAVIEGAQRFHGGLLPLTA